MKPAKPKDRMVFVKLMDCSVSIRGNGKIEEKALTMLSLIVQDRVKMEEMFKEYDQDDEDEPAHKPKQKKVKYEPSDYLRGYT